MPDDTIQYWRGVYDACQYMRNELGIEDAMDTNMAKWAIEALEKEGEVV